MSVRNITDTFANSAAGRIALYTVRYAQSFFGVWWAKLQPETMVLEVMGVTGVADGCPVLDRGYVPEHGMNTAEEFDRLAQQYDALAIVYALRGSETFICVYDAVRNGGHPVVGSKGCRRTRNRGHGKKRRGEPLVNRDIALTPPGRQVVMAHREGAEDADTLQRVLKCAGPDGTFHGLMVDADDDPEGVSYCGRSQKDRAEWNRFCAETFNGGWGFFPAYVPFPDIQPGEKVDLVYADGSERTLVYNGPWSMNKSV